MKYVLAFNISRKKYKNDPVIKIFADDTLVDEFTLDDNYDKKWYSHEVDSKVKKLDFQRTMIRFKSKILDLYVIDEKYLTKNITIKIKNQDSNYTNGFMTKSTVVYFGFMVLLPLDVLTEGLTYYQKMHDQTMKEVCDFHGKLPDDAKMTVSWPFVLNSYVRDTHLDDSPQYKELCDFPENTNKNYIESEEETQFGGDKEFIFPINTKDFGFRVIENGREHFELQETFWDGDLHDEYYVKADRFGEIMHTTPNKNAFLSLTSRFFSLIDVMAHDKYLYENQ